MRTITISAGINGFQVTMKTDSRVESRSGLSASAPTHSIGSAMKVMLSSSSQSICTRSSPIISMASRSSAPGAGARAAGAAGSLGGRGGSALFFWWT
ncbi:hypothetical protein [Duganella sp. P38]|uniref:hypothetical protein n=1 Tax=Duganella sp. P38 TaxID=3423949 RepID=UPI003D7ACF61